jgi:hypothetical protein
MQKLSEFIAAQGITFAVKTARSNPTMEPSPHMTRHFLCTFMMGERGVNYRDLKIPFSQGSAHTEAPTAEDVLDCLASDASSIENARSFEDWAGEMGYDTDSRKHEKVYNACVKSRDDLREFLGKEAFESLLWETERQ